MNRKLGIIASCLCNIDTLSALEKIKAAGFDSFFTGEYKNDDVAKIAARAKELGLTYEFIHAPFYSINEMWMPGLGYLAVFD